MTTTTVILIIVIITVIAACAAAAVIISLKNKKAGDSTDSTPQNAAANTTMFINSNDSQNGNTQFLFTSHKGASVILTDCSDQTRTVSFNVEKEIVIGRSTEADVVISFDNSISKKHCTVSLSNGKIIVNDLQSANKTHINNIEISTPSELRSGDVLRLGRTSFDVDIVMNGNA